MLNRALLFFASVVLSVSSFAQMIVKEEPIYLETSVGKIYGTLKVPSSSKAVPVALIIVGSGPTDRNGNSPIMNSNVYKMLSDALFYNNIATVCFDKRMIGESKVAQTEAELRFDDYVNDVKGWVDMLSADKRFSEVILVGHSEGSLLGMAASENNPKVSKFVSLAGIAEPAANILKDQLSKQLKGQPQAVTDLVYSYIDKLNSGETIDNVPPMLNLLFRPSVQPYMISWFRYNPTEIIAKLNIPVLIVQGTTDIQVPVKQAELLSEACPGAQKMIIENMDHVLKISESTDQAEQFRNSYNNPDAPISKTLVKSICDFIQK